MLLEHQREVLHMSLYLDIWPVSKSAAGKVNRNSKQDLVTTRGGEDMIPSKMLSKKHSPRYLERRMVSERAHAQVSSS